MKDRKKTKEQLMRELEAAHRRVAFLEKSRVQQDLRKSEEQYIGILENIEEGY